jgi:predicted amidohydrolase YtcJ
MKRILICILLTGSWALAEDLALVNGKIFTGNSNKPWATAILIQGERIRLVGNDYEVKKKNLHNARLIDLKGRLVIPGINDAHLHADNVWQPVDLPSDSNDPLTKPSFAELLDALRKAVQQNPKGTWIRGNLSTTIMEDPSADRWALDQVSRDHPFWIENLAGHVTLVNSAALEALHISEQEKDPPGGFYGRTEDGKLNGYLSEYARWIHLRKIAESVRPQAVRETFLRESQEAARFGITSVQHFAVVVPADKLYSILKETPLPIRWRIIWFPMGSSPQFEKLAGMSRLRVNGVKYVLDGTPLERGSALEEPYSDDPGTRGRLDFSDGANDLIQRADNAGEPVLLHCEGDRAANFVLSFVSTHGGREAWSKKRIRIEHGDAIMRPRLKEFAAAGVVVVQNPTHLAFPGLMQSRYGKDRLERMFLLRSIVQSGIHLALGSDGPMNPFLNLMFAITNPTNPAEKLSLEEALLAYTREAAYAEFQETEKGTLESGKLADLAVLSQDIFSVPPDRLPETVSELTIVGGEIVYEAKN